MSEPASRPRRGVLPLVVVLLLVGGGVWWVLASPGGGPASALTALVNRLRPDAGGPLVLQGNVEVRQVNLGFKVAGRIAKLLVDEGQEVREGQALAALDRSYFEDALVQVRAQRDQAAGNLAKLKAGNRPEDIAQAEANVAEREAGLVNANQSLERAQGLLNSGGGTRKAYEDAQAAQRSAEARLNNARQALDLVRSGYRKEDIDVAAAQLAEREGVLRIAERQLADAELKAPGGGVVLSRVREVGSIVNAGETVFVLSLTNPVQVRSYVSEPDLPRIQPGMEVELRPDSRAIAPLKGRVGFMSPSAEFTPKTVETRELRTALVYRLRIVVDDPANVLRQGMPVTISVPPVATAGRTP